MKFAEGFKLTQEIRESFLAAKTLEDVKEIASKAGIELTEDEANKVLSMVGEGKISDEDLDKAAGGCSECKLCAWSVECDSYMCMSECLDLSCIG